MMNSVNGMMSELVSAGVLIGVAVLILIIVVALKFSLGKQPPPADDPQ